MRFLARCKLRNFSSADITGIYRPRSALLTGIVLKFPTISGSDFDFPKKRQGKIFSKEASPLPLMRILYFLSHVTKILTPIGSLRPLQSNFLGGVSPLFY